MNPRRHTAIERSLNVLDKSLITDALRGDPHLLFLFKKTERIAAALYLITSSCSDVEPLKWSLRGSAVALARTIPLSQGSQGDSSDKFLGEVLTETIRLSSLLNLARIDNLLSQKNLSVLKDELKNFTEIIENERYFSLSSAGPTIKDDFFGIPRTLFVGGEGDRHGEDSVGPGADRHVAEGAPLQSLWGVEQYLKAKKDSNKGQLSVKDTVLYSGKEKRKAPPAPSRVSFMNASRDELRAKRKERKQEIVSLLIKKNTATTKDISDTIHGCSEKTIQRLLGDLLREGVLKRVGLRRWSRYELVKR